MILWTTETVKTENTFEPTEITSLATSGTMETNGKYTESDTFTRNHAPSGGRPFIILITIQAVLVSLCFAIIVTNRRLLAYRFQVRCSRIHGFFRDLGATFQPFFRRDEYFYGVQQNRFVRREVEQTDIGFSLTNCQSDEEVSLGTSEDGHSRV